MPLIEMKTTEKTRELVQERHSETCFKIRPCFFSCLALFHNILTFKWQKITCRLIDNLPSEWQNVQVCLNWNYKIDQSQKLGENKTNPSWKVCSLIKITSFYSHILKIDENKPFDETRFYKKLKISALLSRIMKPLLTQPSAAVTWQ